MDKKLITLALLLVLAIVPFTGCLQQGTGQLIMQITDAPGDMNITHCNVTISQVYVHRSGNNSTNVTGGWIEVINESQTFDLLAIQNVTEFFASVNLSAGLYTQVRLYVDECTVTVNGTEFPCKVPSEAIKLVHPFVIRDNATTVLTMDFDVYESVHQDGSGDYIFNPTIKIITE